MGYTFSKTGSDLKKEVTGKEKKNQKWVIPSKTGYTCKNGSPLENRSHFQKWATPAKIGHTWENGSH